MLDEYQLEELLQQAIDPLVPVELFYAVLERIGQLQGAPQVQAQALAQVQAQPAAALQAYPEPAPQPSPAAQPDATELMEQVDFLEAAMSAE